MANFQLHDYGRGVLHVTNPTSEELAYAFLRPQESSGNPKWKGKIFSADQYLAWYDKLRARKEDGRWEFHKEYVGFSIPSTAFRPFYEGRFDPKTDLENGLLSLLKDPTDSGRKRAFVIGTTEHDLATLDHELSRALSHVDPDYNHRTLEIINAIPRDSRKKMNKWFILDGTFSRNIIPQEIVAEFADWRDSYMFKEAKIDRRSGVLQRIHRDIREVYEEGLATLDLQK